MDTIYYFYDLFPKVISAHREHEITLYALDRHCFFEEGRAYQITVIPMNQITKDDLHPDYPIYEVTAAHSRELKFSITPQMEQQYTIQLKDGDKKLCELSIYAVEPDLSGLYPYKGNMHCHTFRSDGVESPEMVAANYRRAGYDFLSITDHRYYEPSLEAIEAFRELDLDFQLFPGEEVHSPGNKIHIIHFAGEKSVNQYCREYPERYYEEVEAIRKQLGLSDSHADFEYAASIWVFKKIREYNGMSILAHPNWIVQGAYNFPPSQYLTFLKERPFDVLELVNGGDTPFENTQQVALWQEARSQGCQVPVTASDDSHGTVNGEWFDIGMTYVLAPSDSKEDLICAMKNNRCIAVERYHGEAPRYYGSYRLISLFSFLDKAYFPRHDMLCAREGDCMLSYLLGEPHAKEMLALLKGQVRRLQEMTFEI